MGQGEYFCIDHDRRVIFFVHQFRASWASTWAKVKGAVSERHLRGFICFYQVDHHDDSIIKGYYLESEYW